MAIKNKLSVRMIALRDIAKETKVYINTSEAIKQNRQLNVPVQRKKNI